MYIRVKNIVRVSGITVVRIRHDRKILFVSKDTTHVVDISGCTLRASGDPDHYLIDGEIREFIEWELGDVPGPELAAGKKNVTIEGIPEKMYLDFKLSNAIFEKLQIVELRRYADILTVTFDLPEIGIEAVAAMLPKLFDYLKHYLK